MANRVIGEYRFTFTDDKLSKTKGDDLSSNQQDKELGTEEAVKRSRKDEGTGSLSGLVVAGYLVNQLTSLQNTIHSMQMSALTTKSIVTGDTHSLKLSEVKQQRLRKSVEIASKAGMAGIIGKIGFRDTKTIKPIFATNLITGDIDVVGSRGTDWGAVARNVATAVGITMLMASEVQKIIAHNRSSQLFTTQHKLESYSSRLAARRLINMTGTQR